MLSSSDVNTVQALVGPTAILKMKCFLKVVTVGIATAFIINTAAVAAAGMDECTIANKFVKHISCKYNNTDCYIEFKIGDCLSCEPSTCDIVSTGKCLFDFEFNSSFNANLKHGVMYSSYLHQTLVRN